MSEFKRAVDWDTICGNYPTKQSLDDPYTKLSLDLIDEEVNGELMPAVDQNDIIEVIDAIGDSFKVLSQLSNSLCVDPEAVFKEVNDSNYSKFCKNEKDAQASVERYLQDSKYHSVYYEKVKDVYVILGYKPEAVVGVDSPKVLKGIHYRPPDIQQFIKR